MDNIVVEINNMTKKFANQIIIEHEALNISAGTMTSIVGESGIGKTTFLKIIGLFDQKFAGEYKLLVQDASKLSDKQRAQMRGEYFGIITQKQLFIERASVRDNILLPFEYNKTVQVDNRYLDYLMQVLNIISFAQKPIKFLSGGQKQRLMIARALIKKPPIILADEPTAALDKHNVDLVYDLLKQRAQAGSTVITVTHDISFSEKFSRVLKLDKGHLKEV